MTRAAETGLHLIPSQLPLSVAAEVSVLRLLPLSLRHDLSQDREALQHMFVLEVCFTDRLVSMLLQEVYAPHLGVHPFFYVAWCCKATRKDSC